MPMTDYPTQRMLGRVPHFDPQNLNYLIADAPGAPGRKAAQAAALSLVRSGPAAQVPAPAQPVASALIPRASRFEYEPPKVHIDQGDSPRCTAASTMRLLVAGPVTQPGLVHDWTDAGAVDPDPERFMAALYADIQAQDRSEGRVFAEGATSLAIAKVGQRRGWWGTYRWGYSLADLLTAFALDPASEGAAGVAHRPVLLGIDWHEDMFTPDAEGIIRARGALAGGHEILADGVTVSRGLLRLANTWGAGWGRNGYAYLPLEDVEQLITAGGDVLTFDELKLPRLSPTVPIAPTQAAA